MYYFSVGSVFFVLFRRIYYITPDFYSLSEKMVAALIVTGECEAETIVIKIAKQCNIIPSTYSPRLSPPKNNYSVTLKSENKCISFTESILKRGKFTNRILLRCRTKWSRPLANTKKHSKELYLGLHAFLIFKYTSRLTTELDVFFLSPAKHAVTRSILSGMTTRLFHERIIPRFTCISNLQIYFSPYY